MNCTNCGEPIPDKGAFCIKCGTKIKDQMWSDFSNPSTPTDKVIGKRTAKVQNSTVDKKISPNSPIKNRDSDGSGTSSFLKTAISALLGILLFVSSLALVLALVFRPSSIPKIIANSNIGKALEQYGITEKIADEMNSSKLLANTVEVEEITYFFNLKSVSEKIGGLSEEYVNAISSGYYDYYLTPKGLVSFLKEISPEISEEFNYKLTKTDYDNISNSFTANGKLKQFTIGRLLDQSQVSYSTPYILFSKYPLIIFAALSALLILDIFLHHRKKIRKAFLNAGIPIAAAGLVFVVVSIIIGPFSDIFSGSNLNGDMNIAKGASSNLLIAGLLSTAVGILAIATFFVIGKVRKNSINRESGNQKGISIAGLIVNPIVLILCGVLLFLAFQNIPEASVRQSSNDLNVLKTLNDNKENNKSPSNSTGTLTTNTSSTSSNTTVATNTTNGLTVLPKQSESAQIETTNTNNSNNTPSVIVKNGDYLMADSSTKYLKTNDLVSLTEDELRIAKNEIFAKHGSLFKDVDLQNYFNNKIWYNGNIAAEDFSEGLLNDFEKKNTDFIQFMESINYAFRLDKSYDSIAKSEKTSHTKKMAEAWDYELNRIYGMLKTKLSRSDMDELAVSEIDWINYKEDRVKKATEAGQDGNLILFELTKQRTLLLIDYYFDAANDFNKNLLKRWDLIFEP